MMACYHENPIIVGPTGKRCQGRAAVRRSYESEFEIVDGKIKEIRDYHHEVPAKAA